MIMNKKDSGLAIVCDSFSSILSSLRNKGVKVEVVQATCCTYYSQECSNVPVNDNILAVSNGAYKNVECKIEFKDSEKYNIGLMGINLVIEIEAINELKDYEEDTDDGFLYLIVHDSEYVNVPLYGVQWANMELNTEDGFLIQN